mmetsp:Transcript_22325/g.35398  ORF Transcript_22325/g.35398 Transcript_22325/m.35398 type:complete len:105 (+) Transcript_22325:331-645(+)
MGVASGVRLRAAPRPHVSQLHSASGMVVASAARRRAATPRSVWQTLFVRSMAAQALRPLLLPVLMVGGLLSPRILLYWLPQWHRNWRSLTWQALCSLLCSSPLT